MKVQAIILLALVATVLAVPELRSRRQASSTTPAPSAVDCGSGAPNTLPGLLSQLGNLLDGVLSNVATIRIKGLLGGGDDLINLRNLINQVRGLLSTLLGGPTLSGQDTPQNIGLVTTLISQITNLLDRLLGNGQGQEMACNNNGGILGGLLGNLTEGGLLGTILTPVLAAVGGLLKLLV